MKISENGIALIKTFEGFSALPYKDIAGFNTIGFGHLIQKGEMCDSITEEKATELLGDDLLHAESIVNSNVTVVLNQNQFDALVSFVFNVGSGRQGVKDGFVALRSGNQSTMLKKLNMGDFEGAAAQFLFWDHADGVESEGLHERRKKEMNLFLQAA